MSNWLIRSGRFRTAESVAPSCEVDLQGRRTGALCLFHPDVRAFWTGLATDLCKSYVVASASPGLKWGDIIFTLGKALTTEVRGGKLFQRIQFATEVNPIAKIAYGLYQGNFLNAVSVGFVPVRWVDGNGKEYSSKSFSSSSSQSSDTLSAFGGEGQGEVAALNLEPETLNSRSAGGLK